MKKPYSQAAEYLVQLKSIEAQINQNQLQQAAQQLTLLSKTASHDPRLFLLGTLLAEAAGNRSGALDAARKAHQLAPQWSTATMCLAGVLANQNQADEALALAGRAVHGNADTTLLAQAAAVAQRLGRHDLTLQWLRQAEKIKPADVTLRHQIARTLVDAGDPVGAIALFGALLAQQPGNPALLLDRLRVCISAADQNNQAVLDAEALLTIDPENEVYQFYRNVALGLPTSTQPAVLISSLFDSYASRYDHLWVVQLKYKLPRDVAQMIHDWHPDRKGDVLDIGCGTGLLGACLGPIEGVLVGVDLSGQMIAQAQQHRVYDSFHQVNLRDALQATPDNLYHVITALDVFTYVGELGGVMPDAYRILVPGGRFVFSCETSAAVGANYTLPSTYRYTHGRSYVQSLLESAGFKDIELKDCVLRHDAGQPVQGFLVVATKPLVAKPKVVRKRTPKAAT